LSAFPAPARAAALEIRFTHRTRMDGWPRVIAFLKSALEHSPPAPGP
jgi:hypothetical protein